jgi:hypothetical protein
VTEHFCTYFDHRYLSRALVLYDSLARNFGDFTLWALCLDEAAEAGVASLGLDSMTALSLTELEQADPEVSAVKPTRSTVEYYFTWSPALPRAIFAREASVERLTYLDADLYFLSSPAAVFDEIGDAPVAIVPHRFPDDQAVLLDWGRFNVGWVTFTRSATGLAVLDWWRERCIEWCYDRVEDDRYADQKYLDWWPELFPETHIVTHPGANLAPWNVRRHRLTKSQGHLQADGADVVFFHVQGLRHLGRGIYRLGLDSYGVAASRLLRRTVYRPYVEELVAADARCRSVLRSEEADAIRATGPALMREYLRSVRYRDLLHIRSG